VTEKTTLQRYNALRRNDVTDRVLPRYDVTHPYRGVTCNGTPHSDDVFKIRSGSHR
jgi:hypothetical protein